MCNRAVQACFLSLMFILPALVSAASKPDKAAVSKEDIAEPAYLNWQNMKVSWFSGNTYQGNNSHYSTLRFDYADDWRYGDNFYFHDISDFLDDDTNLYAEWQPRLSLSKMTGQYWGYGPVTDVLLAGQINAGKNFRALLYGVGFNVKIPGFKWTKWNFYIRDNPRLPGKTVQLTLAWGAPFTIAERFDFVFSGFLDYAGTEGAAKKNLLALPQLMLDVGKFWWRPKALYAGLRYNYWYNRLGKEGSIESLPEFMLTWKLM